ncbi:uncharacterized protein LOC127866766 isoform X3 [Dreissena polymorpha]|uniref:uncharacterized protein LOC127866766 isoform X3 n=1 Tax=Dreissena polymorpha TaxID=45954 RepID=UPI002264BE16|nr:uncharacterized protein LOC127866766 isoform X3 [Dreissena polymorpha]
MSRHRSPCCQRSMRKPCPTLARRHYGDSSGFSRRVSFRSSLYNVCAFGILLCIFGTFARGADAQFNCSKGCTCSPWISGNVKWTNVSCVGQGLTEVPKDGKNGADVFKLDISYNNISSIAITDFQFFTHLRELNMGYNFISTIPLETFTNLTNLQTLILAGNTDFASNYDPNIFSGTTIESLDLSHMKLSSIVKDMFKPLSKLKILNLGYNGITSLEANLFKNLILEQIILSGNQLTENGVHKNAFKNMSSPSISLDLSNNQISSVSSDALDDADVVTSLDLSYNKIESLDSLVFRDVPKLVTLNLRSNRLTTIPVTIFDNQPKISVDLSDNPYTCECAVRNFLYNLEYDLSKTIKNIDQTTCLDSSNTVQVYLDFWSDCSEGNLGSSCVNIHNCMVRNSECIAGKCVCASIYYDNNGNTTAGGLCKSMVELGVACTLDQACLANYSHCGSSGKCECQAAYYDNDDTNNVGGTCLPKKALHASCNATYQCAPANSECSDNTCECLPNFYDFNNVGTCQVANVRRKRDTIMQRLCKLHYIVPSSICGVHDENPIGPSSFYSCAPDNSTSLDSKEVHFAQAIQVTTDMECEEHCFSENYTHYIQISNVCVCGTVQDSGNCCPYVTAICRTKSFLGPNAVASIAGINLSHVPQLYVGRAHMFSVTTTLGIVDQIRWQFGDSEQETVISGKTSSVQHTYTHSGKFWVTAKACVNSTNACESATIPVRVQVQPSNLTTYITGYNKADVSKNLTDMFASFALGYDFSFYWTKKGSNLVEYKKQGCPTNWFSHRYSCIKLVTTPASSFTAAQTACNSDGGKLLQIDHLEELSEIITTLKASTSTFLLGAQKVGGVWQWKQDGSKTSFSDSDLTSTTNGNCVVLQGSSQKLTSNSCTTTAAYACIKDTLDCPKGGTYHTNKYCYVIPVGTGMQKNWSDAQMYCESTYKGCLANISDASTHTLVTGLLTNSSLSKAWFGLSDRGVEGYYLWADDTSFDLATASFTTVTSNNQDCFFTTSSKTWSSDRCSMSYNFVCQYSQNMDRITVATYTTGAQDLDMAPGTNFEQIVSHDNFPQTASATENYLFPGMIFSKPGKVRSWIFHSINITSSGSHDISLQVFRPSCLSGTLYPPGCASTKFSTCSTSTFTCSPSSSCTSSQYFCYLGNMCKPFNETCTCNSVSSAAAFCSSAVASFPRYKLVGQTQITVAISGEKIFTIPAGDISVQELDVVGIQFPSGQNMIKCENKASGRDQQTVFKATGLGWLDKNSNYSTSTTNEELTCYLQAVFTEDHREYFPENLAFSSAIGKYDFSISIVETESKTLEVSLAEGVSDVFWVYPGLSVVGASNTSLGKINTEWNKTYDFTVRVQRGTDVSSVWSFDSTKTVNLTGTCTTAVTAETGSLCNSSVYWSAKPFAVYTHTINTTGKQTLTLTFSNILGTVIKTLEIETEKRIQGFTFVKTSSSLELNAVAVNEVSVFQTSITDGTGVSYSFKVGGSLASSTNSTLQYTFNTVTTIIVEATVTNILSYQHYQSYCVCQKESKSY